MDEAITFNRLNAQITKELPNMSRIKLLTTWMAVIGLDKRFPENVYQINMLLKKIETHLASK